MSFQTNLRRIRKQAHLTQGELAAKSGVSVNAIINYENGRRRDPPVSVVVRLAAALKVDVLTIISDSTEKKAGMEVKEFYAMLAEECEEGMCKYCPLQKFCFTTPKSMTPEIIDKVIEWLTLVRGA